MRVLFVTPIFQVPPAGGPQLRVYNSIKALNEICDLHVLYITHVKCELTPGEQYFLNSNSQTYRTSYVFDRTRFDGLLRWLISRSFERILSLNTLRNVIEIEETIKKCDISTVWFSFGNISYRLIRLLKKRNPNILIVCDTDSVWSRYILRGLSQVNYFKKFNILLQGMRKIYEERRLVKISNILTAVSKIDAEYYEKISPTNNVRVFPNVVDVSSYARYEQIDLPRPAILLAGSYTGNKPMHVAATWFIEQVLPLVKNAIPNVTLVLAGRGSEEFDLLDENVNAVGYVEDMLPYFKNTDVCLVPLFAESGTRFKIMEAGAAKLPIVSTSLGAEGIEVINGEHVMIADNQTDFANAIIEILNNEDLSSRLAKNCYDLITATCSIEVLKSNGDLILEELADD